MLSSTIAERYAKALLAAAKDSSLVEQTRKESAGLQAALQADPRIGAYLAQPVLSAQRKWELFNRELSGKFSEVFLRFLKVVFDHKRERFLEAILSKYQDLVEDAEGRMKAEVTSASRLGERDLKVLAEGLSRRFHKEVELKPLVDPSLLGGLKVRLEDRVYDGTLAAQLGSLASLLESEPRPKAARAKAAGRGAAPKGKARAPRRGSKEGGKAPRKRK